MDFSVLIYIFATEAKLQMVGFSLFLKEKKKKYRDLIKQGHFSGI